MSRLTAGDVGEFTTQQLNDLGAERVEGGNLFVYTKHTSNAAAGQVLTYQPTNYTVSLSAQTAVGQVAVATGDVEANTTTLTKYGWSQIGGTNANVVNNGAVAANKALYTTAVAGAIDDAAIDGSKIHGMYSTGANTAANTCPVAFDRPYIDAQLDVLT